MDRLFEEALKKDDLKILKTIEKSDLHNHGVFGGNFKDIEKIIGKRINVLDRKVETIDEMANWIRNQIFPELRNKIGFNELIKAALKNANEDGIKKLEMSLDYDWINNYYGNRVNEFCEDILKIEKEMNSDMKFYPELGIRWESDLDELYNKIDYFLDTGFFKSIDLYSKEKYQPTERFEGIYKKAKEKGLKLKAHVGEFGTPDDIIEVIEKLGVKTIQHGINAVKSKDVMNYLSDSKIILNICPTSNEMLSRIKSLKEHPMRKLYDNGITVTINSDDMLIFNSSVSEEYLKIYKTGLFSAHELNEIRKNGLNS